MPEPKKDDRDLLDLLKFELRFLEHGGYGHSPHAARRASRVFEGPSHLHEFQHPGRASTLQRLPAHEVGPAQPRRPNKSRTGTFLSTPPAKRLLPCMNPAISRKLRKLWGTGCAPRFVASSRNAPRPPLKLLDS